jgi:hypothetical protein
MNNAEAAPDELCGIIDSGAFQKTEGNGVDCKPMSEMSKLTASRLELMTPRYLNEAKVTY